MWKYVVVKVERYWWTLCSEESLDWHLQLIQCSEWRWVARDSLIEKQSNPRFHNEKNQKQLDEIWKWTEKYIFIRGRKGGSPFSLIWRRKPSLIKDQAVLDFWVNLPIFCHLWYILYLCFSSKNIIIMTKMTGIVMMMVIKMSLAWGQDLKVERTELFDQFNLKSHLFDCLQYSIST